MNIHDEQIAVPFWGDFKSRFWEKAGFASNGDVSVSPFSPEALFQTVLNCTSKFNPIVGIRFYLDQEQQKIYPGHQFLPKDTDQSFEGYSDRLKTENPGQKHCLVINFLENVDFDLWHWSREFLFGLYRQIGFNKLGVYNALFIGNYVKTPFGVHKDDESVFHIPIIGKKAMRIWAPDYNYRNPEIDRINEYDAYLDDSLKIEAEPGGFIYWPSSFWHISEKVDDFSVSLALSLITHKNILPPFLSRMMVMANSLPEFQTDSVVSFDPGNLQSAAAMLPLDLKKASEFIHQMSSIEAMTKHWVKLVTGSNFMNPPKLLSVSEIDINENSVITGDSKYPIVYVDLNHRQSIISANGHVHELNVHDEWKSVVESINLSNQLPVQELLDRHRTMNEDIILEVLQWLSRARAITLEKQYQLVI